MKKIMFNDKYGLTAAVLERRKTQTRRVITTPRRFRGQDVNGYYIYRNTQGDIIDVWMKDYNDSPIDEGQVLPKYKIGEIVSVAQSYRDICAECFEPDAYVVRTSQLYGLAGWSNKMFTSSDEMPHQIRITGVRVERLQDISDEDCMKEGIVYSKLFNKYYFESDMAQYSFISPREAYASLIDKVSGHGTWEKNPYVFVYDFELVQ